MAEQRIIPEWYYNPVRGQPRYLDIGLIREYSTYPDVDHCIKKLVAATLSAKWKAKPPKIQEFLSRTKIKAILKTFLNDILVLDAGVIVKGFNKNSYTKGKNGWTLKPQGQRRLLELYARDGGSFLKEVDASNYVCSYWQYSYLHPHVAPIQFLVDEVAYGCRFPRSFDPYGSSLLAGICDKAKDGGWQKSELKHRIEKAYGFMDGEPSEQTVTELRQFLQQIVNTQILNEFKDAHFRFEAN